jgi:DNA-binding response OmpR family regulator
MVSGRPYDAIIMNVQMPGLDGTEVTRRLRSEGYCAPILALTACAMASDQVKCVEAGFDGFETKPIERAALLLKVESMLRQPRNRARRKPRRLGLQMDVDTPAMSRCGV